jgi:nitrite reductase/ring-hydroxylating ferredoxin subunit
MNQNTQIELARQVFAHIDNKSTASSKQLLRLPIAAYTDRAQLQREKQELFLQYPLVMGFSCQMREPGSYLTEDSCGVPLLVTRARDGAVRAFRNVCSHRGAKIALEPCGHIRRNFTCPYHGWSYDDTGQLVGLPDQDSFDGLDRADYGLVELPAAEKYGLVWVRATPGEAIDIDHDLGGLGPELGSFGFEKYHHYETRSLRQKINWKIAIDTFLEPYHFGVLHKDTVGPIFIPNLCLFDGFGPNLRETLPRRSITEIRGRPENEWDLITHTALVYQLFPNTVLVMQADHVEIWRIFPAGDKVDECLIFLDFHVPEAPDTDSARRHWDRNMDLAIRTVVEEDFPTGETMQAAFGAGSHDHVVIGRNEPALRHFQRSVQLALTSVAE